MKLKILFVLIISTMLLFSVTAFAEEERGDSGEEAKPLVDVPDQTLPVGWMAVQGRIGASRGFAGGVINIDDLPDAYDGDKETTFSTNTGYFNSAGIDVLFFPTDNRRLLLSVGAMHQSGFYSMLFEEDETGYDLGLDDRVVNYYISDILLGIGGHFLYGDRLQHGSNLHFKIGGGAAGMAVDGLVGSDNGGSLVSELGANYFYRMNNQMYMGVQLDFRFWGAAFSDLERDFVGRDRLPGFESKFDTAFFGFTPVLSFIIGFEVL